VRGDGLHEVFLNLLEHSSSVTAGRQTELVTARQFESKLSSLAVANYNRGVPKVTFVNDGKTVEFESGKLPYSEHGKPESLLDVAIHFGVHIEHACGGNCACTTCHVWVNQGFENMSEADEDELDRLDQAADLKTKSRLACQCIVQGDVVVEIPAWNRNYVSEGGGSMNLGDAIPAPKK
jgi:ferredoxin, 2Fe-2S